MTLSALTAKTSSTHEMPASAAGGILAEKNILKICQAALAETLAHGITTSQSIVCCTKLYNFQTKEIPMLYATLGERVFTLCDVGSRLLALRELAKAKMVTLGLESNPFAWALFAKSFKVGACDELSMILATSLKVTDLCIYRIILLGQVKLSGSRDNHVLLAFSEKPLDFRSLKETIVSKSYEFLPSFQTLSKVIVVDAYHEKVIPSEALLEDEDYAEKLHAMGNTKLLRMEGLSGISENYPHFAPKLAVLSAYFHEIKDVDVTDHPHFLDTKSVRIELIKIKLNTRSSTSWKLSNKSNTFWTLGDEAKIKTLESQLTPSGLEVKVGKVKDKEEFCLQINFRNYSDLIKLQSFLS